MMPSARSIQIIIDSWVRMGSEDAMEQAEVVLDRYESHLEELESSGEREYETSPIAEVYRSMLFGWSKCDAERAQEYLLDMVDRHMPIDSFVFDKVIEGESQRIDEDPGAMDRIHEVFETLEKCRRAGEVKPNERVYTSFIRAITRAKEDNLAQKAVEVLDRMNSLHESGNMGIAPSLFTYNAVLNACAESIHNENTNHVEAFKIALGVFNPMRVQRNGLDHVTCGNMLKCANLIPDGPQKEKFIASTFKIACDRGLVNTFVIRDLQGAAPEETWRGMLNCPLGEVDISILPASWSATVNKKQSFLQSDRKPQHRRRFD